MSYRTAIGLIAFVFWSGYIGADDSTTSLLKDIQSVAKQGTGSPAARSAWDKLVARGPAMLPPILQAMDTSDTVVANWLRTAFDRIADDALKTDAKKIDADALLAFVKDTKRQGRARRLALELLEHQKVRPGTSERLIAGWIDDPEFRYEAVATVVKSADALVKDGQKDQAIAAYRKAFAASRDIQQVKQVATKLKEAGVTVSVAEHMGFLTDWYVIGPFDAMEMKGFKTAYPPEEKIDLQAELPGKDGKKLRWKHYLVPEAPPTTSGHIALVNLRQPLGDAEDAVAYAFTTFVVNEAREVEFRGAADDNFTVWVNGKREFGFEEYRNGVRLDRHRFRVKLKAGANTVLVKVCQAPEDPTNKEPNWEFMLRVVDATGKGIAMKSTLPKEKGPQP